MQGMKTKEKQNASVKNEGVHQLLWQIGIV